MLDRRIAPSTLAYVSQSIACARIRALEEDTTMRPISSLTKSLMVLGICAMFLGASWAADDKDQSDITKRIDNSAKVSERNHGDS